MIASARGHQRAPVALWICLLLLVFTYNPIVFGETVLRTAVVDAGDWDPEWLDSKHHRQLLGASDCSDERWGPLCGRDQLLVQLAHGYSSDDKRALFNSLHLDEAVISGYLPRDTWLVVAPLNELRTSAYKQHALLPYSPEYKVAPEWHPVMELVHRENQQRVSSDHPDAAAQHVQLHKRVLDHQLVQQLQLQQAAPHLHTAGKHTEADAVAAELQRVAPAKLLVGVHFPDMPRAELELLGVNEATFNPAAAAAADWEQPLSDIVASDGRSSDHLTLCRPELIARGVWQLDVAVCPQDLSEVLYWLSNQAAVHWLAPRPRLFLQNSIASMIVQDNGMAPTTDYKAPDAHLFWEAGLDGKNQVIAIGDSGIDMHSCYFKDPAVPFVLPTDGSLEWKNLEHRKVIYYWGLADDRFRDLVGHGTHTSGSLAGIDPNDPTSKATGSARSAKLAFVDLSKTAGGDVNAPQDLEKDYFPNLHAMGAHIFSDSWGSSSPVYDYQSSRVDAWLHTHQDCISHFAAGNYGENDNLDTTITSPATAKNVVTVGATKSMTPNYISQTIAPVFMMSIEVRRQNKNPQYMNVRLVKADFGGDGSALKGKGLKVVRAMPPNACGALTDAATGKYKDAIVLAKRGNCFFSEKMAAGTAAGAAALVVVNDRPGGYFKMDAQEGEVAEKAAISLLALPSRMGEELWALFDNSDSVAATIERYADTWEGYEDIAAFSSFGPASDGRIKPDIVCPGELVSASSADNDPNDQDNTCAVGRKSGTSMATPMVAGHTAIVRQYFMDGYYPSGSAKAADAHIPSGPLMKAIMMGGACDMKGNTEQYLPLEDSPSMRQGFGRLCLCSSLSLKGKCNTNVQVVDRVAIPHQQTHKYCLRTTGGDVRIMLVWYDEPAAVNSETTLINDLDLIVVSAGMGGQRFFGNMGQAKDSVNTAERVWLKNVPAGGLDISVNATINSPGATPQNYSLVVQGAFKDVLASPFNPDKSAQNRPAGGCSAAQMLSTETTLERYKSVGPMVGSMMVAGNTTALVSPAPTANTTVDMSTARGYTPATLAPIELAPAGTGVAPPPSVEPASPSPSPAPGGANNQALVQTLIDAMTTSSAAGAPAGRRLTWVPNPPAALTVKVPVLVCQWLSASGLAPEHRYQQEEDRMMLIPMAAVLAACGVVLLGLALVASYSLRRYSLNRSASLTSACCRDLSLNKRKAEQAAADHLREALLADPSLAACLKHNKSAAAAAGLSGLPLTPSRSRSVTSTSSGADGSSISSGTSSGSGSEPSTPTAVAAALRGVQRSQTTPPHRVAVEEQHACILPASNSCPMPGANTRMVLFGHSPSGSGSFTEAAAAAANTMGMMPARGSSPVCSFSQQQVDGSVLLPGTCSHPPPATTALTADQLELFRRGCRSFNCTGDRRVSPWLTQQLVPGPLLDMLPAAPDGLRAASSSITMPLQGAAGWPPRQQQQQQDCVALPLPADGPQQQQQCPPVRRSSSYGSAAAFLTIRGKEQQQQQPEGQRQQGVRAGQALPHDAEMPRDQQD